MYVNLFTHKCSIGQSTETEARWKLFNEIPKRKLKQIPPVKVWIPLYSSGVQYPHLTLCHSHTQTHTHIRAHINAHSNSMRLKVVVLIEYINLTTDVIDQKANSSSIIVLEGKTIAKWLCKVHSLGKQIWDPLKPWRLSSLSPTICGDCSKHLAGDLPRPVESQWETWQGARQRHKQPLHFNYTVPQWLAFPQSALFSFITARPYQYFGPTYIVHMCHRLNSPHDTGWPHLIRVSLLHDRYGIAWTLSHQY